MGVWWSSVHEVLVDRLTLGTDGVRGRVSGRRDQDPDRLASRRSAVRIGLQVAVVSAALVASIILLVVVYVVWQLTPQQQHEYHGPEDVHVYLDTIDLTIAVVGVGGFAVVLAGIATWIIARRAVRPITEASRMQRTFVADASHELRTPLTVLNARVQQLELRMDADDPRHGIVEELQADTRVLIDIVNDLLEVAAGRPGEHPMTPLGPELAGAANDMGVLADARGVRLDVGDSDAVVSLPSTQLRRCIVALVDNAIGHTPTGGTVTVTTERAERWVAIRVRDEGPGITGIAPRRVFDRFAHGNAARAAGSRPTGTTRSGYGIGLALVRDIAVRAGGEVRVEHTGADGTVFLLRLPLAQRTART
ncbi:MULTISPECIES: sensor histidine kinase KdpD [unclassified Curtobacterium]|uniref:sensor histidine kinase n=1 Tax=unclassified Curtobacterium TaxID=257496 RepID=UPI000DA8915B|nr:MULTISPECIES: HAMP domain-containing sensor histidine kinase [unclassified Curtobacterium]PZE23239.1 sensor histidine kinase [Curtobacterium sp. MCBD17_028]PZF59071.1 sensor histidine kinase [Curtobacterium sp. MCBD17_013]